MRGITTHGGINCYERYILAKVHLSTSWEMNEMPCINLRSKSVASCNDKFGVNQLTIVNELVQSFTYVSSHVNSFMHIMICPCHGSINVYVDGYCRALD